MSRVISDVVTAVFHLAILLKFVAAKVLLQNWKNSSRSASNSADTVTISYVLLFRNYAPYSLYSDSVPCNTVR